MIRCSLLILISISLLSPVRSSVVPAGSSVIQLSNDRLDRLHMTDLDGNALTMSDFDGKPVFLNFWATWCKPCVQEMSDIQQLYQMYGDSIIFLAASIEDIETIRQFRDQYRLSFQLVRLDIEYIDAFVITLPTTLLIDRQGEVRYEEEGLRIWDSDNYDKKVRDLLY